MVRLAASKLSVSWKCAFVEDQANLKRAITVLFLWTAPTPIVGNGPWQSIGAAALRLVCWGEGAEAEGGEKAVRVTFSSLGLSRPSVLPPTPVGPVWRCTTGSWTLGGAIGTHWISLLDLEGWRGLVTLSPT